MNPSPISPPGQVVVVVKRHAWKWRWARAGVAAAVLATSCILLSWGGGLRSGYGSRQEGVANVLGEADESELLQDIKEGRQLRWKHGLSPMQQLMVLSRDRGQDREAAELEAAYGGEVSGGGHNADGSYWEVDRSPGHDIPESALASLGGQGVYSGAKLRSKREVLQSWGWGGGESGEVAGGSKGGGTMQQLAEGKYIAPTKSSKLWDFPEIKRYQVQTSRDQYWPNIAAMKANHAASLNWPGTGSSDLSWPSPDGSSTSSTKPQMVKAGALLQPGELMPRTRPWVAWSAGCSSVFCPLATPQRERAVAWRYCTNHFVTNAEARYCFAAVLSPAKPPPSCPPYEQEIAHGHASSNGARVTVGGHVDVVCDTGYVVSGDAFAVCEEGGGYSSVGSCVPIICGPYPAPDHATADPSGGVKYGETVKITCDEGYTGGWDAVCGDGGKYKGEGECVPQTCPPYPPPPHASVSPEGRVSVGEEVDIVCDAGYQPKGHEGEKGLVHVAVVCGPDGEYKGEAPECVEVKCPPYEAPEHGSVSSSKAVKVGEHVDVSCDEGYEMVGGGGGGDGAPAAEEECLPDGTYAGPAITCVRFCPPFPAVPRGTAAPTGRTHVGDVVTVTCEPGTYPKEGDKAACGADGAYTPPSIACEPVPQCPAYPPPEHGHVSPSGPVAIGDGVHITCDAPWVLSPNSSETAICTPLGTYDHPVATCVPELGCPPYPPVEHGTVTPESPLHVGDQVVIKCDPGYHLDSGSSDVATCTGTEYDFPNAYCVPLPFCPALEPPEHSTVHPAGNVTLGGCVVVKCDAGYAFDPEGKGKEEPCCIRDLIEGDVHFEEPKKCYKPEDFCEVCNDLDKCPHCFIGSKKYAGRARDFHFD